MQYVIKQNENIYDVALKLYGDASLSVRLLSDNPILESLENTDIANITVTYDPALKKTVKVPLIVSNAIISDSKQPYLIKDGQSIYDLSISFGYGIEQVAQFILDAKEFINLNQLNIKSKVIYVTKKQNNVTDALNLQNKKLATNVFVDSETANAYLATGDGVLLETGDGLNIIVS